MIYVRINELLKEKKKMSKLLNKFNDLKKENASSIYIFRVGIFYNILNDDAKILSNKLGLKLTDLGPNIIKCGFPISQLDKYVSLLNKMQIKHKIIDNLPNSNINDYMKNVELKKLLTKIADIDMNNTTFQQFFNILLDLQKKLKNLN